MKLLEVKNLNVYYGLIQAIKGIDFEVEKGEIISLIGSNGAGKTSTLLAIVNDVKREGVIKYKNEDISKLPTYKVIKKGIALVPEGRRIFINLTIEENLKIGAYNSAKEFEKEKEFIYTLFPRLKDKSSQLGGTLSGGEQQMLAISRALMSNPQLLMLDEPSLGLAPKIVHEVFEIIKKLRDEGISILLVEQNANAALSFSDYCYVLENGKIVLKDKSKNLINNDEVRKKYLGV